MFDYNGKSNVANCSQMLATNKALKIFFSDAAKRDANSVVDH